MKKWLLWTLIIIGALLLLVILGGGNKKVDTSQQSVGKNASENNSISNEIIPKGNRIIGIDYTPGKDISEEQAFLIAKDAGMGAAQIYLQWNEVETDKEVYGGNGLEQKLIDKNKLFSQNNVKVILSINEIAETGNKLPADLQGKDLDDPVVIQRYEKAVDYVFSKLPDAQIEAFSFGNEVDSYLGGDDKKWEQYTNFVKEVSQYIKAKKPNVNVGVKSTFDGYTNKHVEELQKLSDNLDVMLVTYYPMTILFKMKDPSVVREDFNKITSLYQNKKIYFAEAGYTSSPDTDSSEEQQAEFIKQIFIAWDEHPDQVGLINFLWLHDLSPETVDYLAKAYPIPLTAFREYLRTLGLRTYEGQDKLAFKRLKEEAKKRGWGVK